MKPSFADLRLITTASECFQTSAWSMVSASCDPWGRPFNYPSLWVKIFATMGITEADTSLIGHLEILILCISFFYWIWRFRYLITASENGIYKALLMGFLLSPPVLLLMERGNVDTLMFAGLTLVAELLRRQSIVASGVLIALLGSLKVYPFAGAIAVLISTTNRRIQIFVSGAAVLAGLLILGELSLIADRSMPTYNSIVYGSSIFPMALSKVAEIKESRGVSLLLGLILVIALSVVIRVLFGKRFENSVTLLRRDIQLKEAFNLFGTVFTFTFLLGLSFDMRLVLLLPLFIILYQIFDTKTERLYILVFMILIMYGGHLMVHISYFGELINLVCDALIMLFSTTILLILVELNWGRNRSTK